MPRFLLDLLTQFRAVWSRLDAGQRWLMASVVALTVVGLGAIVWAAGRPDYQVVFEASDPEEISSAVRALSQAGVPMQRDGRGIAVRSDAMSQARSVLYENGLLGNRGGSVSKDSLLNQFTLDRDARKDALDAKNRVRAEQALLKMDGVLQATVTSSLPGRNVFTAMDKDLQPRASVLIKLRPGAPFRRIAAAAVDAVAAAVGIAREKVVVVNSSTQERFGIDENTGGVDDAEFYALQRTRGDELGERAQQILDRLYPDQARVQVTVELDPSWELRQEKIVPDTPIVVSDKTTKQDTNEISTMASGDPSATAGASEASAPRSTKKDTTAEKTYEPFRGTASKGKYAPDVRKMSVAVVLDEKLQLAADKLKNLENLIKNCVGFSGERGDGFAVHVEKFPEIKFEPPASGPSALETAKDYLPTVAQLVGVVLVLGFLRNLLKRAAQKPPAPVQKQEEVEVPEESLTPEENLKRMRRDIEKAINDDPAAVSRMLESWLTEVKS